VLLVTIDGKRQIGYQSCKDLDHKTVLAPCNQMIYLQVSLPPGEEVFDIPPELIGCRDLLRRKIIPVCGNPVFHIVDFIPDKPKRFFRLVGSGSAEDGRLHRGSASQGYHETEFDPGDCHDRPGDEERSGKDSRGGMQRLHRQADRAGGLPEKDR